MRAVASPFAVRLIEGRAGSPARRGNPRCERRRARRACCGAGRPSSVRQAETIRQELLHLPGVKKVNILGERPERIFVEFSYPRLVTLGVTALDIFAALRNHNAVRRPDQS